MGFDSSQALKYAEDNALAVPSILGIKAYPTYLITVYNDDIGFGDSDSGKSVTAQRLTLADGYRSYAAGDGYLNPIIKQLDGSQVILSNGMLTSNTLVLGPLVFPYDMAGITGGIDATLFQPASGSANNKQIYIWIQGVGLAPNGNFFEVKEVIIKNMTNLTYKLLLVAVGDLPDLTNAVYSFLPAL
jgi:hypothetical protein